MENHIISSKTFRYFTKGENINAKNILFVLHGYGQLASFFIKKFDELKDDYLIVAPEGMHRFYLNGSSGRVGASWMTKEDRENDIIDNNNWLNELMNHFQPEKFEKIYILGFSQGGATAARWSNQLKIKHQLILWACVFPPDLEMNNSLSNTENENNHFILGENDEYFDSNQQKNALTFYKSKGFKTHTFKGKHTINSEILKQLLM